MAESRPTDGQAAAGRPFRRASVALILYERDGEPWTLFTRRTDKVADHKGQISLPGGSREPADPSSQSTALRETQEELGVDPDGLRLVAGLRPVATLGSRYWIEPFVFYTKDRPEVRPESFEVAEVIDVPLAALLAPNGPRVEVWDTQGVTREVFFYQYGDHVIWGATGRIVKQFLDGYSREWWEAVRRGEIAFAEPGDLPPTPA